MDNAVTIMIFGASGDLTERKLIPALYHLQQKGRLPQNYNIIGNSRSEFSHEAFRDKLLKAARDHVQNGFDEAAFSAFAQNIWYLPGNVKDGAFYEQLNAFMSERENGTSNRLYYLSTAPFLYEPIIEQLGAAGMNKAQDGWQRVVIEKPFGYDLESAHALNDKVHHVFKEDQVYRIDHYLGKETAQNILYLRFANTIFEPIWNRNYINHIQITVAESVDVGRRAGYYDTSGVMRDMFQNHLLQLLALTTMEPPTSFNADALRNEKVKLLQAVYPVEMQNTVRAQYDGYCGLEGVDPSSQTPTFAALKLFIGNWRWDGVPIYMRSGKAMPLKTSEITVQFKRPPHMMFRRGIEKTIEANRLTIHIQPNEGIDLGIEAKIPGTSNESRHVLMDFQYDETFGENQIPDAYERLILDAIQGDAALFSRSDGIEAQWGIVDHVINGWATAADAPALVNYAPGSWGPQESDELLARAGHQWHVHDH